MMSFDQQSIGAVTILKPRGPVANIEDSQLFFGQAENLVRQSLGRFVVDASEMSYVDSTGLEALVDISQRLNTFGQPLKMCGVSETLSETIRVTQTADSFDIFDQVQDAVRSYR